MSNKGEITNIGVTDEPGSPVSMKKLLDHPNMELKEFNIFVCNDTFIIDDDPSVITITAEDCAQQADYFLTTLFNGTGIPHYTFHHMLFMFGENGGRNDAYKRYPNSVAVAGAFRSGNITEESEDYKFVLNLFKWGKSNPEFKQVLGMIQLIAGNLNLARKHKSSIRLHIKFPETNLHPKRQAAFTSMLMQLRAEYEVKDAPTRYNPKTASLELETNDPVKETGDGDVHPKPPQVDL